MTFLSSVVLGAKYLGAVAELVPWRDGAAGGVIGLAAQDLYVEVAGETLGDRRKVIARRDLFRVIDLADDPKAWFLCSALQILMLTIGTPEGEREHVGRGLFEVGPREPVERVLARRRMSPNSAVSISMYLVIAAPFVAGL